ncbi:CDGSH iron-sulfur domain-containing protein [Angustibacter aerolatus]|uniref:Iron-binding zinc finger CDGSH type domain-containing protein n=1 Tax=Angustibacter aerolatus TaxID=1162965 RepID=A0ABQ6JMR6_9ACTN|nr:CDGSH iron-sulfur domain-containing protein [Angustibacter aerolatus]GMA88846.1 hypothetical protein GCM10025868_40960 [Angustibacter aerolatus]
MSRAEPVSITVCDDGPLLLRGDFEVIGADGQPVPTDRRTVALCRCGRTARAPWCDGTHKAGPRRTRPAAAREDATTQD